MDASMSHMTCYTDSAGISLLHFKAINKRKNSIPFI